MLKDVFKLLAVWDPFNFNIASMDPLNTDLFKHSPTTEICTKPSEMKWNSWK